MKPESFRLNVPDSALADLRERLKRARWPDEPPLEPWSTGTSLAYMKALAAYWAEGFDWRAWEARVNTHPQYLTEIDGQTIHFLHVPSSNPDATPLLLAHTYPGSFLDYLDLIEPLREQFSLVIPSMPGFGFSTPVVDRGWTMARVARIYDTLMRRLGYERYGIHGSDGGAMVARELGLLDPPGFLGAHVLHLFSFPSGDPAEFEKLEPADYAGLEHLKWFQSVGGYNAINASRPQTVAVGLSDSNGRLPVNSSQATIPNA